MSHITIKILDTNVKVFFLNNIEKKTLLARSLKIDYYHIRSVETDSSLSGPEVKRRKKLTYFNGGGQKMWEIQSSVSMRIAYYAVTNYILLYTKFLYYIAYYGQC